MKIEGSTLRLDAHDRENSLMMSLQLPAGSSSGGLLVAEGGNLVFVLFAHEGLEAADEVVVRSGQRFTVTSSRDAYLDEEPVTVLRVRPSDTGVS